MSISKTAEALVFAGSHALSSKSGSFRDTFAADSAFEHVLVVTSGSGGTPKPSSLSVTVNGVEIVRAGDVAYYAARRQISVGAANILDVTMRGTAGATVAIAVMRVRDLSTCPPFVGLAVTSPSEGETVSEPLLPVTGTAFGPAEIHVYVNGESALLERNHAGTQQDPFPWSTDLWIKPGATTVTAAAVIAGPTAPVEIRRAVAHEPPPEKARITAAPQNGTAPLTVSYSFSDNFDDADSLVDVDFEGDGTYDVTHNGYPEDLTHIYATAGTYEPSVRATRIATGEIFTAATTVRVESIADVDTAIRAQWSNFLSAVSAADVDAAMTFMTAGAREKYRPILESTAEHLPGFAASIVSIGLVTVDDTTAKYVCSRTVDGVERGHWVVFQKDDDGFWKILQF